MLSSAREALESALLKCFQMNVGQSFTHKELIEAHRRLYPSWVLSRIATSLEKKLLPDTSITLYDEALATLVAKGLLAQEETTRSSGRGYTIMKVYKLTPLGTHKLLERKK